MLICKANTFFCGNHQLVLIVFNLLVVISCSLNITNGNYMVITGGSNTQPKWGRSALNLQNHQAIENKSFNIRLGKLVI